MRARGRKCGEAGGGSLNELNNLHLVDWQAVIIDINSQSSLRQGNIKGNAVKILNADRKLGLYESTSRSSSPPHVGTATVGVRNTRSSATLSSKSNSSSNDAIVCANLKDVMVSSKSSMIPMSSIMFEV